MIVGILYMVLTVDKSNPKNLSACINKSTLVVTYSFLTCSIIISRATAFTKAPKRGREKIEARKPNLRC
jgi:hypothetical protein